MFGILKKINGTIAVLLCTAIVLGFSIDFGKYTKKGPVDVDYSKFIEASDDDTEVFNDISLDEDENLLLYTVCDKNMGYIQGKAAQALEEGEKSSSVCAKPYLNYRFVKWSDGIETPERTDVILESTEIKAEFEYVGFPDIYITVADVKGGIGEEYSTVAISVSNVEKEYAFEGASAKARIRGNSSARFDKKSYKLKFSSKTNLLGLGKAEKKDWVLIANHSDQSLMRNYVAYNLAKRFDGFEIAYSCAHVNVYINGEYNGVYLLTEQVETGKSRVNIDTDGLNDDIGFLLELDSREELGSGECIQIDKLRFAIKSDFVTNGQYNYAKNYLSQCNNAIKKGNKAEIESLIDIDSFLDMYLLQEYAKNFDVGFASLFMYIKEDGGKLYFGPAWDFDISMGNDDRMDDGGFEELFVGTRRGFGIGHEWFILMSDQKWFRELVAKRYDELFPLIKDEISDSVKYYLANKKELEKNFDKWKIFGDRILFEPDSVRVNKTHEDHFDYLIMWLEGRNNWMLEYFSNEKYIGGDSFFDKLTDRNQKRTNN